MFLFRTCFFFALLGFSPLLKSVSGSHVIQLSFVMLIPVCSYGMDGWMDGWMNHFPEQPKICFHPSCNFQLSHKVEYEMEGKKIGDFVLTL